MHLLPSNSVKAAAATSGVSAIQAVSNGKTIEIDASLYSVLSVAIALIGIYLARLVTVGEENRRLGRPQSLRETGPLTWVAVLIVCPMIWHFEIAIPWASIIGLGVGYSVKVVLKIIGAASVATARSLARTAADALDREAQARNDASDTVPPAMDFLHPPGDVGSGAAQIRGLVDRLDQTDEKG